MNNQFEGATIGEKWERYVERVEAAGSYGALGITDYFSIDGYLKALEFKEAGRLANVSLLLPNVELRILPVTGHAKAINVHLILAPTIVDRLDELLWTNLEFRFGGNTYKCTRNDIIRLGRAHLNDNDLADAAAYRAGIEQFKIDFHQIEDCLTKNKELRDHTLVGVANGSNDGNSGIQESGLAALRKEIYRSADMIFSGNPKDRAFFLGQGKNSADQIRESLGSLKPCVHGCDAHELDKIGKPEQNRYTWIKADATFEGLRQILFEPETRVWIGDAQPPTPIHRAREVQLSVPSNTSILWDGQPRDFCLRGENTLALAAGLTCIIGGRGAGKSTLLNMIQERIAPTRNIFWRERQLRSGTRTLAMSECVNLTLTGDHTQVEFVAQNEVEQFALNPARLTDAIFGRLRSIDMDGKLRGSSEQLEAVIASAKQRDGLLRDRHRLVERIAELRRLRESLETLAKSFTETEYVEASGKLQAATASQQSLAFSRDRLNTAIRALAEVVRKHEVKAEGANDYDVRLARMIAAVESAVAEAVAGDDLTVPGAEESRLSAIAAEHRAAVEVFLESRGLSPENLRDVSDASSRAGAAAVDQRDAESELSEIEEQLKSSVVSFEPRTEFEDLVRTRIQSLNERFSGGAAEARRLELQYSFDNAAAEDDALAWLNQELSARFDSARVREDYLRSTLEKAGGILEVERDVLIDGIRRDDASKTAQSLDAFFGIAPNIELWENERARLRADVLKYMRIDVLYDGKPLSVASFGQRCSAVLVVLISLGNSPIVIDEPEAHLDSAIIADFMVEMVKRVKQHRQVIFATHNANFVVNGDAELIHVLSMDAEQRTSIQSATLEDLEMRPLILALEGGERAFRQREGRYRLAS